MIKLGIIGAMQLEVETLVSELQEQKQTTIAGSVFYEGSLNSLDVVIVQCGVGKVNASLCAQILCSSFGITHLVNTGIAGSLCNDLDIGDFVISSDAMYHDFDCVNFGYPFGQVPGIDVLTFVSDDSLLGYAFASAEEICHGHTRIGRIASGDQFVASKEKKQLIIQTTHALCTEMEGTAIAHTAYRNRIPFVIIRSISDKADESAEMDYPTFERNAAYRCAEVTKALAKKLYDSEMS